MAHRPPVQHITGLTHAPLRKRRARYFAVMGTCIVLFVCSWSFVRLYSVTAAVVMSAVAAVLPPLAAIIANAGTTRPHDKPPSWR